jgi:hypothetical protein
MAAAFSSKEYCATTVPATAALTAVINEREDGANSASEINDVPACAII